ncbi:unnamed protein product [Pleuronectes platessa]|uniref:Uncharacterized protein n=1 Tax=Pleuronectes platessa TaxID=8262 RepID=A0A9N7VDR4_PLEPL|nr:unnamed protein product [Pleuronectes platessa]
MAPVIGGACNFKSKESRLENSPLKSSLKENVKHMYATVGNPRNSDTRWFVQHGPVDFQPDLRNQPILTSNLIVTSGPRCHCSPGNVSDTGGKQRDTPREVWGAAESEGYSELTE